MRLEARFGDRVVPAFCERPTSIWAMIADAAARNPDGEALVCGERRMTWREVAQQSAQIAAGFRKLGLQRGDRVALLLGNRIEFVLTLFGRRPSRPGVGHLLRPASRSPRSPMC